MTWSPGSARTPPCCASVVTSGLVDAVSGVLVFVGSVIAMALISRLLLGLTLVVVAVAIAVVIGLGGRIQKLAFTAQTQVGLLAAGVGRAIPGHPHHPGGRRHRPGDRRAAGAGRQRLPDRRCGWRRSMALIAPIIGIAMQGAFIAVLGVGGYLVADGSMQVAQLVAFILYLFMMIMPLGRVFQAYTATQNALGAVIRIREITSLPEEEPAPPQPAGRGGPFPPPVRAAAVRRSASAGSASATVPHAVLSDLSFTAPRGHQDRDRRAVRCRQVDDPGADRAVLRPGRGRDPAGRRRRPRADQGADQGGPRLRGAGLAGAGRDDPGEPAARRAGRHRRRLRGGAGVGQPRRRAAPGRRRARCPGRRGRHHAVRRRAAAAGHRQGPAGLTAGAAAGRADRQPGRPERAGPAAGDRRHLPGPDADPGRAPAGHGGRRRPDPGAGGRPAAGRRHPRRPCCEPARCTGNWPSTSCWPDAGVAGLRESPASESGCGSGR